MDFLRLLADIHEQIAERAASGMPFAVATILHDAGSTPRKIGTKAMIDAAGGITGTIGGGQVEAEVQRRGVEAIGSGEPVILEFALTGNAGEDRPVCGGAMRVLVDPTAGAQGEVWRQAAGARRERRRGAMLTRIEHGPCLRTSVHWVDDRNRNEFQHYAGASSSMDELIAPGAPRLLPLGETNAVEPGGTETTRSMELFVEPLAPAPLLLIAGGGHVGQALALQARIVGFEVQVIDDRPEFLATDLYPPGTRLLCRDIVAQLARAPIDRETYIALVTRGHRLDETALAACIAKPAAYIGMIGSRRKVALITQRLLDTGRATPEQIQRLCAPIGLPIGAQTVPEIAASIVAELVSVRRTGSARRTDGGRE